MSTRMLDRVWQSVDVTGAELLLLLSYADICDDDGNGIWCSDEYTVWKTGVAASTLAAIKKKWREMKVLYPVGFHHLETRQSVITDVNVVRGIGGRGWAVLYQLCLEPLPVKAVWKHPRAMKVPIDRTFNDGRKVPIDRTFRETEGSNSQRERSQPAAEKVPMVGAEGPNRLFAYKEDPLVEPLGNPLGEEAAPFQPSEPDTFIEATEQMLNAFAAIPANSELAKDEDDIRRMRAACRKVGLSLAQGKELLAVHEDWKGWQWLRYFDAPGEIPFPLSEDFPEISFAQRIVEELCLQHEPGMMHAVAGAIAFCVKFEKQSKNSAVEFLIARARAEIERGGVPSRFWFTDRKWRGENGNASKVEARAANISAKTRRVLSEGL